MTKKNYVAIAAVFAAEMSNADSIGKWHLRNVARELATVFKTENAAFDRDRFLTACGVA